MGDNIRELRTRIASIKNTQKITQAMKLVAADAAIQVVEEKGAPRFALFGMPVETAAAVEGAIYWEANFETKEAYHVDHKARESNKVFAQELFKAGLHSGGDVMVDMMKNMDGSYMGPIWHLEGVGAAKDATTFTVLTSLKSKGSSEAGEMVEACKKLGLALIGEGALRTSVCPTGGDWPGEKDDVTVVFTTAWASAEAYEAHKAGPLFTECQKTVAALMSDAEVDAKTLTFGATQHFAKPA